MFVGIKKILFPYMTETTWREQGPSSGMPQKGVAMKKLSIVFISTVIFVFCIIETGFAQMGSENFRIQTAVQSGSGTRMNSNKYQMNSTLGQSSPLIDSDDPTFSINYDLYSGFWYAVKNNTCEFDYDGDTDVDGLDLSEYIAGSNALDLKIFAEDFGRINCY
jgi:hypothetical protein